MTNILAGTADVVSGSPNIVWHGAPLYAAICPPDSAIAIAGAVYFVLSLTDTTHVVLTRNFVGSTASGLVAEIDPYTDAQVSTVTLNGTVATYLRLLQTVGGTGIQPNAVGGYTSRATYDSALQGYVYLSLDGDGALVTTPTIFIKNSNTTGDWSEGIDFQAPAQPEHFDLALFAQGTYNDGDLLFRYEFTDTVVFAAGLSGSKFSAGTAATGSVTLSLNANGVAFGTVNFAAGVTEATFTAAANQTFAPGDVLTVFAPIPKDASLANVSGVLRGSRDAVASINQSGLAVLNFGSFPGTDIASVTVTGEAGITAGSIVEAWVWPGAGTAEHSADEHRVASINLTVSGIVAGTGFTINGYATDGRQYGRLNVAWRWL